MAAFSFKAPFSYKADHGYDIADPDGPPWPGWCVSPDVAALGHRDYRVVCRTVRMAHEDEPADAALIAAARNALPAILSELAARRAADAGRGGP